MCAAQTRCGPRATDIMRTEPPTAQGFTSGAHRHEPRAGAAPRLRREVETAGVVVEQLRRGKAAAPPPLPPSRCTGPNRRQAPLATRGTTAERAWGRRGRAAARSHGRQGRTGGVSGSGGDDGCRSPPSRSRARFSAPLRRASPRPRPATAAARTTCPRTTLGSAPPVRHCKPRATVAMASWCGTLELSWPACC